MPGLEAGRGRLPDLESPHRIEQVGAAAVLESAAEVLVPQPEPELAGPTSWRVASMRQSVRYTQSPAARRDSSWCSRAK
jgi:hypothetical protein